MTVLSAAFAFCRGGFAVQDKSCIVRIVSEAECLFLVFVHMLELEFSTPCIQSRNVELTERPLDFPSVKASSIALGTVYTHAISLAVLGPVFGDTYSRAQAANTKEEFLKSKEAAGAAAAWGTSLAGSVIQTYGVGAILVSSGTMSTKGAAAIGGLVFLATSAPSVSLVLSSQPQGIVLDVAEPVLTFF